MQQVPCCCVRSRHVFCVFIVVQILRVDAREYKGPIALLDDVLRISIPTELSTCARSSGLADTLSSSIDGFMEHDHVLQYLGMWPA